MNIVLHDYSGHPFQVQMSRELARRGHVVTHVYFRDFQTPKGALGPSANDPQNLSIIGISLGEPFAKAQLIRRRRQEIRYGREVAAIILRKRPDIVISSNAPLDAQRQILSAVKSIIGCSFIFWLQDLYGEAIRRILSARFRLVGRLVGAWYITLEARMLRHSDQVISITDDFRPILLSYGVAPSRITTIENWAPLDDIEPLPKRNSWSIREGCADTPTIVYSGTLGYKHNPDLLFRLAVETEAKVLVFSEGPIADALSDRAKTAGITSLSVRPRVDFSALSSILSSADILVALIESDAGIFSVPSKILSYACVGRPILASIPKSNLAARILERESAGLVASPHDGEAFIAHAKRLLGDTALRAELGRNARAYAERQFDIRCLADRFEAVQLGTKETVDRGQLSAFASLV